MLTLRVVKMTWETPEIFAYELRSPDGTELPAFTAGAHITLQLPGNLARSYSLLNSQDERHRFVIAVQKDRQSRGGSAWIHDNVKLGDLIEVAPPTNNFTLDETAEHSCFIAGGIGLTPILSMMERLRALKKDWSILMCARSRSDAPFCDLLADDRCRLHFDREAGAQIDLRGIIEAAPATSHFYCCGPEAMIQAFEQLTAHIPRERIHVERFKGEQVAAKDGGFTVILARSGLEIFVPPGKTILQALSEAGSVIPYSCNEGICGTCETAVIDGIVDHRDAVLSEDQKRSNKKIIVCCSGAKSERLVLDI